MESGKYVKSGAGCDGQCGGSESSAKHYYRGMGRNRLHQSADGFHFRPPIPLFLWIIEKTGEFVINLTNEKLAKACDYCGVVSGRDVDKFKKTGLTPVPVENVKAPAIAESPVNIACRVVESHPLGSHTMFVAEVLGVTVDDAYLDETGKFDINGTGLIMYSHGEYFALGKKLGKFGYSVQKKKK